MSDIDIKEGDAVELVSGGPVMTVEEVDNAATKKARCTWFDKSKRNTERFKISSLRKVDLPK